MQNDIENIKQILYKAAEQQNNQELKDIIYQHDILTNKIIEIYQKTAKTASERFSERNT